MKKISLIILSILLSCTLIGCSGEMSNSKGVKPLISNGWLKEIAIVVAINELGVIPSVFVIHSFSDYFK